MRAKQAYPYNRIIADQPRSSVSEAYRTIRANIQYSNIDEDIKTILVTSSTPGEGKTVTSTNLACAMAQNEMRTLYIDADLRKPTGHQVFGLGNRHGLTSWLLGRSQLNEVIQSTAYPGLSVITSGPIPPNPAELLGSNRIRSMLQQLKELFDIIIIDSPPVMAVADPIILGAQVDGCVLVLDTTMTKRDLALTAKLKLDKVNTRMLGVIINNKKEKGKSYNYYYED
ncbi:CpsD/CapB family tyrosine-protein kinase [Cohnella yongneupensis]|uniref:non-specific protein-tyrosine kinase n=1 Tax=Cohnella yongneupensis TaxID=425006 RepID=A0ABW0R862_9BACL